MSKLKLEVLGPFRVTTSEGEEVRASTRKSEALLLYLASPPDVSHTREWLAGLLWSRSAEEQARSSLRQTLARIRTALGPSRDTVCSDSGRVNLAPESIETDIQEFEQLASDPDLQSLERAASLVRGEFAAGLAINEAPFQDWLESERRRFAESAIATLAKLLVHYEEKGQHDDAAVISQKLLSLDPLQESVHQSLMRALAEQQRYESALQQFKLCKDLFRKELGIEPNETTCALRDAIAQKRKAKPGRLNAPSVETEHLLDRRLANPSANSEGATNLPPQLRGLNLAVPARPSIAILPFQNLTGNPEEDYIADGIRIDIQAALVKITGIFLIAAGSANAMRGKDAMTAGNALGVQYVLQGSLRKSGRRLRIGAELVDSQSGFALWTETYDRTLSDDFAVQDEIIQDIITQLDVKLLRGEQAAVWHRTLKNLDALETFYKGVHEFFKMQKEANLRARQFFERVEKAEPGVAIGATWTALCHWLDVFKGWTADSAASLELARDFATKAINLVDADGQAHMVLSHVHLVDRKFDDALLVGRQAIALRPNCTNANGFFANVLHYCGEQRDAIEHVNWAIRYSPVYPPFFADVLSLSYLFNGNYEDAIHVAGESMRLIPGGVTAQLVDAAARVENGDVESARAGVARLMRENPGFSLSDFAAQQPYRDKADLDYFINLLTRAGLRP